MCVCSLSLSHLVYVCVTVSVCLCESIHVYLDRSENEHFYALLYANLQLIMNLFLNAIYHLI